MAIRTMGKVTFLSLRDREGDLQAFVKKDKVGDEAYEALKLLDLGDLAWVKGRAMRTRTGELSIEAGEGGFQLLAKALRPLPEKWHGLHDVETRYRQRYVDLAANPEVRETFKRRTKLITGMRRFLDEREFVEVETPILHTPEQAGGAAARTFQTQHNALDLGLKLRIATELHLKRLIVGGFERVYEIGRIFRNEGIDRTHCPEFTTIEFYEAYATYQDLMKMTEEMISRLCMEVTGNYQAPYQGAIIDYRPPWPRVSMLGEVAKLYGIPGTDSEKLDALGKLTRADFASKTTEKEALFKAGKLESTGEQIAWAFETFCEPMLPRDKPAFVVDFPLEISPLARKRDGEPRLVDRFEAFAGGFEIANAFTELNDPRDQEARFRAQVEAGKRGNEEAMPYDRDFVRALEFGMPPTAGEGIGIDRLAMLFTDSPSIRDVILFPLLRPEAEGA
jgi:lysyl-tRNA synthetase class 2